MHVQYNSFLEIFFISSLKWRNFSVLQYLNQCKCAIQSLKLKVRSFKVTSVGKKSRMRYLVIDWWLQKWNICQRKSTYRCTSRLLDYCGYTNINLQWTTYLLHSRWWRLTPPPDLESFHTLPLGIHLLCNSSTPKPLWKAK